MQPPGQLITLASGNSTINLAVSGIRYTYLTAPFDRPEFTSELQMKAPETDGGYAMFDYTASNKRFQFFTGCTPQTARRTTPDDSVVTSIYKRWDISRFEIEGADTLEADIDNTATIYKAHLSRDAQFKAHIEEVRGNMSITYLVSTLQADTFSYITSTSLTMSGRPFGAMAGNSGLTNCLITSFEPDVTRCFKSGADPVEITKEDPAPSTVIYRSFKLVIEQRRLSNAKSTSFSG